MPSELHPLIAYQSGSAGDRTYARNQFGLYDRSRTTPVNTDTSRRRTQRRWFSQITDRWGRFLTQAQRQSWNDYARSTVVPSSSVRPLVLSGQQYYIRVNVSRPSRTIGFVDDAPVLFGQPVLTPPSATTLGSPGLVFITINPADPWANESFAGCVCFVSPVRPASINFFKGPFRYCGIIRGVPAAPPPVTSFFPDPWGVGTGARRWLRTHACRADGRLTTSTIVPFTDNT